ncbi:hypothetical protein IE53DRAFT_238947 [Violaceomyces palustris]|uniref:Uncharacterized protein n=1 Tax=Violaceomyces palustris TaxID=1673888 RepID=A0ACD0P8A0_9BASI|nr:hypothetical protein IE53DRAFT_238947 [Violaceomyces palustris]
MGDPETLDVEYFSFSFLHWRGDDLFVKGEIDYGAYSAWKWSESWWLEGGRWVSVMMEHSEIVIIFDDVLPSRWWAKGPLQIGKSVVCLGRRERERERERERDPHGSTSTPFPSPNHQPPKTRLREPLSGYLPKAHTISQRKAQSVSPSVCFDSFLSLSPSLVFPPSSFNPFCPLHFAIADKPPQPNERND